MLIEFYLEDLRFNQNLQRLDIDPLNGRENRIVFRLGCLDEERIGLNDRGDPDIAVVEVDDGPTLVIAGLVL